MTSWGAEPAEGPLTTAAEPPTSTAEPVEAFRVLGIRHHGPGSARSVRRALEELRPQCVLIEGPADADELVRFATAGLQPPVALLAWCRENPSRSAFWPFAVFSPEWQALSWAVENGAEVRFMDLPSTHVLAENSPTAAERVEAPDEPPTPPLRTDPIARLARVAGYSDPEAWWEDVVELTGDSDTWQDPFDDLLAAMHELREEAPETDPATLAREAQMRQVLRAARKSFKRIAVVCGAWHAPALAGKLPAASGDAALVRALPKTKTDITWVPWTHSRLSRWSGYGAGIDSPGWYHHLFTTPDRPIERWLTLVAGVLRANDLPVSSAHIIEAVRLSEALAGLRGRPMPGLDEVTEATWSVMCEASELTLDLVSRRAVVGEALGSVPDEVPTIPLDADLRATAKRLRLKFEASAKTITLDLRKPNDLAKSHFFQRLQILSIDWARPERVRSLGTFKEGWVLAWAPEHSVAVIEAGRHGTSVEQAAGACLLEGLDTLADVTEAIELALKAELTAVLDDLMRTLDERAAHESDVGLLLEAVVPLARSSRYGDVRGASAERLAHLAQLAGQLLARACAGLPVAAVGADDELAGALRSQIDGVQLVVDLLDEPSRELWHETLVRLVDLRDLPGLVGGRLTRILSADGTFDADETAARVSRALSIGVRPNHQAPWVEGYLAGNPLLLVHDARLLRTVDEWVRGLDDEQFKVTLPVVRRAFGAFDASARRLLADKVKNLAEGVGDGHGDEDDFEGSAELMGILGVLLGGAQ